MGFKIDEPINHVGTGAFQPTGLANVGGFVKAGFQFDQGGDRFAVFGSFAQGLDNRTVPGGTVKRLLYRDDIGVTRRLRQKPHDHVEGFIGVVQKHVLGTDCREHVAVVVLNPFGDARGKQRPE